MEHLVVYANLIATFGLGMLLAAVVARVAQAARAFESAQVAAAAAAMPTEDAIARYLEGVVERELPRCLQSVFEDRMTRLAELKDDVRRSAKKEAKDALERTEFQHNLEEIIQSKLTRGPFPAQVKATIDEHYRLLTKYLEEDLVPQTIDRMVAQAEAVQAAVR